MNNGTNILVTNNEFAQFWLKPSTYIDIDFSLVRIGSSHPLKSLLGLL